MSADTTERLGCGLRNCWINADKKLIESIIENAVLYSIKDTYVDEFWHLPEGEIKITDEYSADAELVHFDVKTFLKEEEIKKLMAIVAARLDAIFGVKATYTIYVCIGH